MRRTTPPGVSKVVAAGNHTIVVEGQSIAVEPQQIPLDRILLDPSNPRIQHAARRRAKDGVLSQDSLCALILDQPGVSDLFKTIRDHGGLLEPIYVRPDGRIIEGNCRAASFIRMRKSNQSDLRWQAIPAFVVPHITERQVAVLQGHFHVAGKNKWRAYEKAGHLHTMHTTLQMDEKAIARSLGMQERVVIRLLQSYKTMTEKVLPRMKGNGLDKWSHVEEFFKIKELEEFRGKPKNVDQFVDLVVSSKLKHGVDVRKLPQVLRHSKATEALKRDGIDKAISVVGRNDPTANSVVFRKLKEVTELLRHLPGTDLRRLRDEVKPQQLIQELSAAIKDVAKAAGLKI